MHYIGTKDIEIIQKAFNLLFKVILKLERSLALYLNAVKTVNLDMKFENVHL